VAVAGALLSAGYAQAPSKKGNSDLKREAFGKLPDGTAIELYTLANGKGMQARIMTLGATVVSLTAPDKAGKYADVVLGMDSVDGYVKGVPYFGAIVGRYGNRIGHAQFQLAGKTYTLPKNDGDNTLHGGVKGFDKRVWTARANGDALRRAVDRGFTPLLADLFRRGSFAGVTPADSFAVHAPFLLCRASDLLRARRRRQPAHRQRAWRGDRARGGRGGGRRRRRRGGRGGRRGLQAEHTRGTGGTQHWSGTEPRAAKPPPTPLLRSTLASFSSVSAEVSLNPHSVSFAQHVHASWYRAGASSSRVWLHGACVSSSSRHDRDRNHDASAHATSSV